MQQTFHIVPASGGVLFLAVPIVILVMAVMVLVPILLGGAAYASRKASFEVSDEGLRLSGEPLYGLVHGGSWIPAGELRGGSARIVDFSDEPDLKPKRRSFGTGLPGYAGGWFRLASGEKAIVYLTDLSRAVYVPTTTGHAVLVSVTRPTDLVAALREIAPRE